VLELSQGGDGVGEIGDLASTGGDVLQGLPRLVRRGVPAGACSTTQHGLLAPSSWIQAETARVSPGSTGWVKRPVIEEEEAGSESHNRWSRIRPVRYW
jgi:hypothetical protein